jgi:hypothetical protein
MFNFWAYILLIHLSMPILSHSLLVETCLETDHYTNTRGYCFYFGRYQYQIVFAIIELMIRQGVLDATFQNTLEIVTVL